jgi:hypothetical protein
MEINPSVHKCQRIRRLWDTKSTQHNFQARSHVFDQRKIERRGSTKKRYTYLCLYILANEKSSDIQLENL